MRFTCEKSMLVTGLNITSRTVAQKSALSSIEGILCQAGYGLRLTGYNMETAITYEIEAEVSEAGACILPAKLFSDIIRRLPEGPVTVVVDEQYKVSVRAGYASFTISAENAEDYPELPDVSEGRKIYIPQAALKNLISSTIFATAGDNKGRPIHTGVKFEIEDTSISAIAVDGFRLARKTYVTEEPTGRSLSFVVPAQGLKEVEKILGEDEQVAFVLGNKHILFEMGNATLVCRLLEGSFLDWRKVVPTNSPIRLVATVSDLVSALERVGLMVSEKYRSPVRCLFTKQELHMKTNTTIGAAEDKCSFAGDGKELKIGFDVRYLLDALRVIETEEVVMELTNNMSPIVFTSPDEKLDFAYMVLPVRINS